MALAVGEALIAAPIPYEPNALGEQIRHHFIKWYHDPENNRAPGRTCMTACQHLDAGELRLEATRMGSKGCGANMRVMPVGLLSVDQETRAKIAQLQAAYTHGHPTGLAAADLTAFTVVLLIDGETPEKLPILLRDYAESQRETYHADWLENLWEQTMMMPSPQDFIRRGWDECLSVLDRLDAALVNIDRTSDPCLATGTGWIAEEALATALLCFLMYPDDPEAVIQRAAVTSGDSDSIACIAGSFAGAYHGIGIWKEDWIYHIEYHGRLQNLSKKLVERNQQMASQ